MSGPEKLSKLCHLPTGLAGACGTLPAPIEVAVPDEQPIKTPNPSGQATLGIYTGAHTVFSSLRAQERTIAASERISSPWEAQRDQAVSPEPSSEPSQQPAGFLQTVAEVIREHPGGFISAALDLVLGRGKFTKEN